MYFPGLLHKIYEMYVDVIENLTCREVSPLKGHYDNQKYHVRCWHFILILLFAHLIFDVLWVGVGITGTIVNNVFNLGYLPFLISFSSWFVVKIGANFTFLLIVWLWTWNMINFFVSWIEFNYWIIMNDFFLSLHLYKIYRKTLTFWSSVEGGFDAWSFLIGAGLSLALGDMQGVRPRFWW